MRRTFRLGQGGGEVHVQVVGSVVSVSVGGQGFQFALEHQGAHRALVAFPDGRRWEVLFARLGKGRWQLHLAGRTTTVVLEDPWAEASAKRAGEDGGEVLRAPIPGRIVEVLVAPGNHLAPGAPVVVLEAMKMQNLIATQAGGQVQQVLVVPGATVERGQVLAIVG